MTIPEDGDEMAEIRAVSYTHLDVYKRQIVSIIRFVIFSLQMYVF